MSAGREPNSFLDRLDGLSPWAFTGVLYWARWVVVLPISYALGQMGASDKTSFDGTASVLFFGFIFLGPVIETVTECVIPYWLMRKMSGIAAGRRAWGFVAVSAGIMTLLHVGAWPAAILPSLVTGGFLAYVYAHFAVSRVGMAMLHTWAFHAAINIVGWSLLFVF
jgi:hypothetical protein